MKKKIFFVITLFLISLNVFSETWVSDKGQTLSFTNVTSIKFKKNCLEDLGKDITRWKNANITLSINDQGNALCEIIIVPDNYDPIASTEWIAWLYSWFIRSIEVESQKHGFISLGFFVKFRLNFSRGSIEQYAALRRSGYVKFYDDMHLSAGLYTADSTNIQDWLYPKYNDASKSWNSGYLYKYIIGDFDSILDLPVPEGLDDSFKKNIPEIPNIIKSKNWSKFNTFVSKYDLKLKNYFSDLLENNAPLSVFSIFSEGQKYSLNYEKHISSIMEKDKTFLDYFYKYFNKAERKIVSDYLISSPDDFIQFNKKQNCKISSIFDLLPENLIMNCSLENIEYLTKDYKIDVLYPIMSKLENNKIEIILKERNDNISEFLKFYYLNFDDEVSFSKLTEYSKKLEKEEACHSFYCEKFYCIDKTICERLIDEKYSEILRELFDKNILKIVINRTKGVLIRTDLSEYEVEISDYSNCSFLKELIDDAMFEVAYWLFSEEIDAEDLFFPQVFVDKNYKFSLYFDDGTQYRDSKTKTGNFLFGELKKGKIKKKKIDFLNSENETLLFKAIREGNDKFAQQLIQEGIDISIINKNGKSAIDIAKDEGNVKIQKLLEKKINKV